MDFKDSIVNLASRFEKIKDSLKTEEATKNGLIMPFLTALGYDVFNPLEVLPEMVCDIGKKKGEKIDYAILFEGKPVILIECKQWEQDLSLHDTQLLRYFTVSNAKFGILTNGVNYRFYTDLVKPNVMDSKPFLEINLLDLKEAQIEELKKFHKSYFDVDKILSTASELKYMGELKTIIAREFEAPSMDFVKLFGKKVYDGTFTTSIVEQFTVLLKRALSSYVNDLISNRLKAAIGNETPEEVQSENDAPLAEEEPEPENAIVTTELELNGFYIIKSILRKVVDVNRIFYKDTLSYFAINIDNTRKLVCRLYFNNEDNLRIAFLNDDRKEERIKIEKLDDIYNFSDRIISEAKKLIE
jgi:hypothetical protein